MRVLGPAMGLLLAISDSPLLAHAEVLFCSGAGSRGTVVRACRAVVTVAARLADAGAATAAAGGRGALLGRADFDGATAG